MRSMVTCLLLLSVVGVVHAQEETGENETEFKELFNGRDLAGWEGDERIWRVEDGLLTGQTTPETKLKANTFAIWTGGEVADFQLKVVFRLEGDNNSGVQYRSQRNPKGGEYSLVGYQADIHPAANYVGMLYDEGGRGIAAERGQRVALAIDGEKQTEPLLEKAELKPVKLGEWTTLEVIARGNRLVHKINGETTVEVTDNDPENMELKGLLGLQVHAGPPMKVQYKSVKLKRLKAD